MNTFDAAILYENYKPLLIKKLESVDPGQGQIAVKVISAGLCGAQINEIDAVKGPDKFLPHLMGHEGFGQVTKTGPGTDKFAKGDYVVMHWRKGSGCECFGPKYQPENVGSGSITTFAEQSVVSENRLTKVKYNKDLEDVYPLMGCALSTAYGTIVKEAKVSSNSRVLIAGGGGLGLALAFWLKVLNLNCKVDILEKNLDKKELLSKFDGNIIIEFGKYDFVFETTGNVDIISKSFTSLDKKGKLILVGQPRTDQQLVLDNPLKIFDGITIFSSDGGGFDPDLDLPIIVEHVENNIELANELITHRIKLNEINEGFDLMRKGEAGRIVINFKETK
jgi:Zn-dependent alcohol dehydrogenase